MAPRARKPSSTAKKAPAKKAPARPAPARQAAKKVAAPVKKAPARKASPAKKVVAKRTAAKKAAPRRHRQSKTSTTAPVVKAERRGAIEMQARAEVEALTSSHPMKDTLAEMAFTLARTLDRGAGLAVAAVNRELRANLVELARLAVTGDDEDLDSELSTPIRNAPQS